MIKWMAYQLLFCFLNIYLFLTLLGVCCCMGFFSSYSVWASRCGGFSCCEGQAVGHMGFSSCGSKALEYSLNSYRLNCSAACGIFPDQGSNSCLLHWQAGSLLLSHPGSPVVFFFNDAFSILDKKFILLCRVLVATYRIFVAACRLFSWSTWDQFPS